MKKLLSKLSTVVRFFHKKLARETILVLGDSHVTVFHNFRFMLHFPFKYFQVVSVGGATASGLENPRSKTQAYNIFNDTVAKKDFDKIIIMLGEVDTGFVIWYRASKYNTTVEEMFHQAVDKYTAFISRLAARSKLIVISTPLPTIDEKSKGEVAHARKEVKASQLDRTKLTLKFNKAIENYCKEHHIDMINLDNQSLGKNGLVIQELKNKIPTDHHYDADAHAKLIISELKKVL
ncbi:SGNH/GDSL hydrolase family protein [Hydrogenimonas cancrithermarum]|uniref:SGNH hydrolase-type esterase domain-containing protein n=1 Tax=Hydrogenimonas cancrithermarum TaxID=2993563 RepID=A0ABN6WZ12_9BACT|nr:hypothetical protein [Hydrogenimonas cancrithermarum]BDY13545.1 hypothetical protein HCR_18570 [Hydrogenimonas cancrithermarum]